MDLNQSVDAMPDRGGPLVALDALAQFDPRKTKVVEMPFFGGLSVEETAAIPAISPQSVMTDWKLARAWIMREMAK